MRPHAFLAVVLLGVFGAAPVFGQEVRDFGTTTRGRVSDGGTRLQAQDAADRARLACRVTAARARGRDANGTAQYEVACAEGPGFIIVDSPVNEAISCLAPSMGSSCTLRANRNPVRFFARMADQAGLECRVDEGAMLGLSTTDNPIYEIGCSGEAGAWLEPSSTGWRVTDCITVRAQGGECRFTTPAEAVASFREMLSGGVLSDCAPDDVRAMGRGARGIYYEVRCQGGPHVVARFDDGMRLRETVPCASASRLGGGCRLPPD